MLSLLKMKNIAIFDDVEIEFNEGLNIITGETGAGKSITLKAIELLSGGRASSELVRNGAESCEIQGMFELEPKLMESLGVNDAGDGELVIRRKISKSGRGKIYVCGNIVSQAELKRIGEQLIDFSGQHYQQTLLDTKNYRSLLDSFGVDRKILEEVTRAYQDWKELNTKRKELEDRSKEKDEYLRRIAFEKEELDAFCLTKNEKTELEDTLKQQESVESLSQTAAKGLELLDSESGIVIQLSRYLRELRESASNSEAFKEAANLVESAELQLGEAVGELRAAGDSLSLDPETLETMRQRFTEIVRLERKYGKDVNELATYLELISSELELLESGEQNAETLRRKEDAALEKLTLAQTKLTKNRQKISKALSTAVDTELKNLDMKKARFKVELSKGNPSPEGIDSVEFLLAANPGEPFRPLQKVASGGELSRVVLILKTLLNSKSSAVLQVFDEVDSGVGGAVAYTIGEKLKVVSSKSQVILVTHSPQVAAFADKHHYVSKKTESGRTSAFAKDLIEVERVGEVARMLAGKNVSGNFIDSAKELIESSNKHQVNL